MSALLKPRMTMGAIGRSCAPRLMIGVSLRSPLLRAHKMLSIRASATTDVATNGAAPPAITFNVPEAKPAVLPPAASYQNIVSLGTAKGTAPAGKLFLLGIMAGVYIAFGSLLMIGVGGMMPGLAASNVGLWKLIYALVFPFGLGMVLLGGAELYTGNTLVVTSALMEGKISFRDLLKNFVCSYAGNLVGSLLMVSAVLASGVLAGNLMAVNAAVAKTSLPLGVAVVRAILANWLVCIAVMQAAAASSLSGKMLGLWPPVTAFIALGLEHSVANMFVIPLGIGLGAKVTFTEFLLKNLIPVTIGNTIAGVICMASVYAMCFGEAGKKIFPASSP